MITDTKGRNRAGVIWALVSGGLLFLSFPRFGTGILAWIALVPLLMAVHGQTIKRSFYLGFLSGLVAHLGILYWIAYVVVKYGNLSIGVGAIALLLLVAYMSLYPAIFAAGVVHFAMHGLPVILFAPLIWTALEYIKTYAFTGFPWELLGYSQYRLIPLIQISDITGVYGVSFVIVLVNAAIYDLMMYPSRRPLKLAGAIFVVALVMIYGVNRVKEMEVTLNQAPDLTIGIVQGNIDQSIKWDPAFQRETMTQYINLSKEALKNPIQLLVWPETATPFFFQDPTPYRSWITELARERGLWFLFGSPSYRKELSGHITMYNSVFLLSPQGKVEGKYDKVHLVPYGEYVPLRKLFPFISKLVHGIGDFGTGPGYIPIFMGNEKIGVLICYEAIFPEGARRYATEDVSFLVNVTNDAWFGRSSAPYQHLSMAVFRAVENKKYFVRAANTGISALIDPFGRIYAQTGLFEPAIIRDKIKLLHNRTLYGHIGDAFSWVCIFCLFSGIIISIRRKKK